MLVDKYKEFLNIRPENVGIDEKFALNTSSPIIEIFDIMAGNNTRINASVSNFGQLALSDSGSDVNSDSDENNFSDLEKPNYEIKVQSEPSADESIIYYSVNSEKPVEPNTSAPKDTNAKVEDPDSMKIDPFLKNTEDTPRHRFYSNRNSCGELPTIKEIRRRLSEKPYNKAIMQLRQLDKIEEPRKKLRLLGQVNDSILE